MSYSRLLTDIVTFDANVYRNIKTIRRSQALYDDLSDDATHWAIAIAAETATNVASQAPFITRPFDYGTAVAFPFVPSRWHSTRFSEGTHFGVWYGALDMETTVFETVFHWARFVDASYAGIDRPIRTDRRVFSVTCDALLVDLRAKHRAFPGLVDRASYAYTQPLGAYLKTQHQNGLLVQSARSAGINAALFRPDGLRNPLDFCQLEYEYNPAKNSVKVSRQRGKLLSTIEPSSLQ